MRLPHGGYLDPFPLRLTLPEAAPPQAIADAIAAIREVMATNASIAATLAGIVRQNERVLAGLSAVPVAPIGRESTAVSLPLVGDAPTPAPVLKLAATPDGPARIADLVESWSDEMAASGNAKGYVSSSRRTALAAAQAAGWYTVPDITVDTARAYVASLRDSGLASSTVRGYRDCLYRFCDWLRERGELPENPFDRLKAPKIVRRRARVVPTDDETRRIILAGHGADYRAKDWWLAVYLMAVAGLRVGECRGMRSVWVTDHPWIDLPAWLTKPRREERAYLTPDLHAHLRHHRDRALADGRERLFESRLKRSQVGVYCGECRPKIAVVRGDQTLSYHSFRHAAAARMGRCGFGMDEARWAMRHVPQGLTATVYDFSLHEKVVNLFSRIPLLVPELAFGARSARGAFTGFAVDTGGGIAEDMGAESASPSMLTTHDQPDARPTPQGARIQHSSRAQTGGRASGGRDHDQSTLDGAHAHGRLSIVIGRPQGGQSGPVASPTCLNLNAPPAPTGQSWATPIPVAQRPERADPNGEVAGPIPAGDVDRLEAGAGSPGADWAGTRDVARPSDSRTLAIAAGACPVGLGTDRAANQPPAAGEGGTDGTKPLGLEDHGRCGVRPRVDGGSAGHHEGDRGGGEAQRGSAHLSDHQDRVRPQGGPHASLTPPAQDDEQAISAPRGSLGLGMPGGQSSSPPLVSDRTRNAQAERVTPRRDGDSSLPFIRSSVIDAMPPAERTRALRVILQLLTVIGLASSAAAAAWLFLAPVHPPLWTGW